MRCHSNLEAMPLDGQKKETHKPKPTKKARISKMHNYTTILTSSNSFENSTFFLSRKKKTQLFYSLEFSFPNLARNPFLSAKKEKVHSQKKKKRIHTRTAKLQSRAAHVSREGPMTRPEESSPDATPPSESQRERPRRARVAGRPSQKRAGRYFGAPSSSPYPSQVRCVHPSSTRSFSLSSLLRLLPIFLPSTFDLPPIL